MPRTPRGVAPTPPAPGQESVWDFPRPAIAEPTALRLRVRHRGETVAETRRGLRVLETSHPPTYYFPPEDVAETLLRPAARRTLCEWKGAAEYFDATVGGETLREAVWRYPRPSRAHAVLAGFYAFHPAAFEECLVEGERAAAQEGGFYGGWITSHVAGPFKGPPGTEFW